MTVSEVPSRAIDHSRRRQPGREVDSEQGAHRGEVRFREDIEVQRLHCLRDTSVDEGQTEVRSGDDGERFCDKEQLMFVCLLNKNLLWKGKTEGVKQFRLREMQNNISNERRRNAENYSLYNCFH